MRHVLPVATLFAIALLSPAPPAHAEGMAAIVMTQFDEPNDRDIQDDYRYCLLSDSSMGAQPSFDGCFKPPLAHNDLSALCAFDTIVVSGHAKNIGALTGWPLPVMNLGSAAKHTTMYTSSDDAIAMDLALVHTLQRCVEQQQQSKLLLLYLCNTCKDSPYRRPSYDLSSVKFTTTETSNAPDDTPRLHIVHAARDLNFLRGSIMTMQDGSFMNADYLRGIGEGSVAQRITWLATNYPLQVDRAWDIIKQRHNSSSGLPSSYARNLVRTNVTFDLQALKLANTDLCNRLALEPGQRLEAARLKKLEAEVKLRLDDSFTRLKQAMSGQNKELEATIKKEREQLYKEGDLLDKEVTPINKWLKTYDEDVARFGWLPAVGTTLAAVCKLP